MPKGYKIPQESLLSSAAEEALDTAKPWLARTPALPSYRGEEGFFVPGFAQRALIPRWQQEEATVMQRIWNEMYGKQAEMVESPFYQKWLGKQARQRAGFYNLLEPRAFRQDILTELGYGHMGDELVRLQTRAARLGPAPWKIAGELGIETVGPDYAVMRTTGGDIPEITSIRRAKVWDAGKFTERREDFRGLLSRDLASWELGAKVRITPGKFEPLASRVAPELFYGKEANWVLGRSATNIHYMSPRQQVLWGQELYGQTKYLQDIVTGKPVLLGGRNIIGVEKFGDLAASTFATDLTNIAQMDPHSALMALKGRYATWKDMGDPVYRRLAEEVLEPKLRGLAGEAVFRPDWKIAAESKRFLKMRPTIIEMQKAMEVQANMAMKAAQPTIEKTLKKGFTEARDLIEGLDVGTQVRLTGNRMAKVAAIEGANQVTVQMATGRAAWLTSAIERATSAYGPEYLSPESIPLFFTRIPTKYIDKFGKEVFDKTAVAAITPSGDQMAWVKAAVAKELYPEIEKGLLPIKRIGKIYTGKNLEFPIMGIFDKGVRGRPAWTTIIQERRLTGTEHFLRPIGEFLTGEGGKYLDPKDLQKIYPTKYLAPKIVDAAKATTRIPSASKYLVAGAAITAGALLLYTALKSSRQRPIDERDIPKSMYGDTTRAPLTDSLATYQPQARIVQNNRPGTYDTNIDMETEDFNNTMDYRQLANTMSQISRSALGINRINTDLHVVDDSSSTDSRGMQRQFAEYLNR